MKHKKITTISFDYLGGKNVMPIGGYFGPYLHGLSNLPNYFTDETFRLISEAGINLIVYNCVDYAVAPETVKKSLELGEKYGVGIFVTDTNVLNKTEQDSITAGEVAREIAHYKNFKAFCGMYLVDEPQTSYYLLGDGSKLLPKYEKLSGVLQEELGILYYSNLNPLQHNNKADYERYVKDYCDTLKPRVLSWDYYPFDKYREGKMENYFYNMDLVRRTAEERNIPFWAFAQAGSQWNDTYDYFESTVPYYPNEGQFNWNVNTSLAFGAKGIQYFPLVQPKQFAFAGTCAEEQKWDFERNGIIGGMCNRTQWYYYAQRINKHISEIDEVLMNSLHEGVIISGEQAHKDMCLTTCVRESGKYKELLSVTGDAMVGCFDYQGQTALYVVNYSFESTQNITLEFEGEQDIKMIRNAQETEVHTETLALDMAAGEGVLIVIQQSRNGGI